MLHYQILSCQWSSVVCYISHPQAVFAALAALAAAAPEYSAPRQERYHSDEVPIIRHDFVLEDDGRYNLDVETGNGIYLAQSGAPDSPTGAVIKAGQYS